jgi:ABC-type nitrate/sulfonate/bicarbonate transport system substrate-binding protein
MSTMVSVLLLAIFVGYVESHATEKIRISVSGDYNMIFLSAGVAQHRGFFKDERLDADSFVMGAAPFIAALTNGASTTHYLIGTVIRAAIRGLPVRLVAGLMTSLPHVLLAHRESNPSRSSAARRSVSPPSAMPHKCRQESF